MHLRRNLSEHTVGQPASRKSEFSSQKAVCVPSHGLISGCHGVQFPPNCTLLWLRLSYRILHFVSSHSSTAQQPDIVPWPPVHSFSTLSIYCFSFPNSYAQYLLRIILNCLNPSYFRFACRSSLVCIYCAHTECVQPAVTFQRNNQYIRLIT